jgi:hypothetical protein
MRSPRFWNLLATCAGDEEIERAPGALSPAQLAPTVFMMW